jgi:hypothetical protein
MRGSELQRLTTAPEIDPLMAHLNLRYLCQLDPEGLSADSWSLGYFVSHPSFAGRICTDCIIDGPQVWELLTGEIDIFRADSPPTWPSLWWSSDIRDMLAEYGTRCCLSFLKFVSERSYPRKPIDHPVEDPGWNRFPENHEILFSEFHHLVDQRRC